MSGSALKCSGATPVLHYTCATLQTCAGATCLSERALSTASLASDSWLRHSVHTRFSYDDDNNDDDGDADDGIDGNIQR